MPTRRSESTLSSTPAVPPTAIHLIRTHYPHWGAHSGYHQFARYLDRHRFRITERLASDSDDDFPVRHTGVRRALRSAVQRRGMAWYKLSDLTAEIDAAWRSRAGRADIVHYLDGEHSAQYLPRWRSVARVRLVASYHQPPELLDGLVDPRVVARLDCVIVVSPTQVPYFERLTGAGRTRLILHGIDTAFFQPPARRVSSRFRCLTVGHYLRDFEAVAAVARHLQPNADIQFHVVAAQAGSLRDHPNITLHSGISDESLVRLYQEAHVLLLPLLHATSNNALLEGMACGLPLIVTAFPSIEMYTGSAAALFVERNDPDELLAAILRLASQPDLCLRMGEAARKRALELDWCRVAPHFATLYAELGA